MALIIEDGVEQEVSDAQAQELECADIIYRCDSCRTVGQAVYHLCYYRSFAHVAAFINEQRLAA
jgi:hypothetical protein